MGTFKLPMKSTSGTYTMKYDESTIRAFATLRVSGDDLIPSEVTDILCIKPTLAYAKGERYNPGKRSGEMVGRTGVWYFNTDTVVQSYKLINHILFIFSVIAPDSTLVGTVLPTTTRSEERRVGK